VVRTGSLQRRVGLTGNSAAPVEVPSGRPWAGPRAVRPPRPGRCSKRAHRRGGGCRDLPRGDASSAQRFRGLQRLATNSAAGNSEREHGSRWGKCRCGGRWIAEHISAADVCVTSDTPLASSCLKKGARAGSPSAIEWTEANIGHALAGRDIARHLRELGQNTGGPPPLTKSDRSRFLVALDTALQAALRARS
jgi:hypothetical protein